MDWCPRVGVCVYDMMWTYNVYTFYDVEECVTMKTMLTFISRRRTVRTTLIQNTIFNFCLLCLCIRREWYWLTNLKNIRRLFCCFIHSIRSSLSPLSFLVLLLLLLSFLSLISPSKWWSLNGTDTIHGSTVPPVNHAVLRHAMPCRVVWVKTRQ